jgi:hypothetical protein
VAFALSNLGKEMLLLGLQSSFIWAGSKTPNATKEQYSSISISWEAFFGFF